MKYCENLYHKEGTHCVNNVTLVQVFVNTTNNEGFPIEKSETWCLACLAKEMKE